ncbi:hypothetical protein PHYSODRAFT_302753 [Phytophthora sojae]|uniref:Uncharacterized protein n=1 Tax=Phytophthora sojae (strain P6497) TaxID=1094619 RepID=G4ZTN5_PHYSP|nr:hypothetical protein PHYSODRAFT_302753 [Phytophthora sojae]EGZ12946.1 hypothetical protein PHYSODRAFT_302753 [Phytophthora sojae]|eukprot:XP_009530375.1 hypothetical protein PHYSODRAFT_302753 [Phytophthora sojae]
MGQRALLGTTARLASTRTALRALQRAARPTPHGLLRKIGKSITEEPRIFQAWVGQTSNPDSVDIDQYPSITTREFLASLSEGDESDAEVERARGQQQPTHTPRTPLRTTQRHAPSSARQTVAVPNLATEPNVTDEDAAELELIEFIRDQRPHLLVPNLATEPNVTDEDAAELELIKFIRDQRPHLLRTYFSDH